MMEFTLDVQKITPSNNIFEGIGAKPGELTYGVILNGGRGRWDFLAAKNGRSLYSRVSLPRAMWPRSDSGQSIRTLFQEFVRQAD